VTQSKTFQFQQRWRALEKSQRDLDFAKAQFARELRAEFPSGKTGDGEFIWWCETELGLTEGQVRAELLARAAAIAVVPDEKTWTQVGGFKAIRKIAEVPARRDQVAVIEAVKASGKAVTTVLRERGLDGLTPVRSVSKPVKPPVVVTIRKTSVLPPSTPANDDGSARADAIALSQYVARTCKNIPREIMKIIAKYSRESAAA